MRCLDSWWQLIFKVKKYDERRSLFAMESIDNFAVDALDDRIFEVLVVRRAPALHLIGWGTDE